MKASALRTVQIPELRYYVGDALARLERYAEAEPILGDEVRLFPSEVRAHAALAMLYRATGRVQQSDREIETADRLARTKDDRELAAKLRQILRSR